MTRKLEEIRRALADYIRSEGCDCCRDSESHSEANDRLAALLEVPAYSDGSGWNFGPFETPRRAL